jgi:hypothetical protein
LPVYPLVSEYGRRFAPVRGLPRLTIAELRLLLRDATALPLALALPVGFLLIFGSMASGVALGDCPAGV